MTRDEAKVLVDDLLQAHQEYENAGFSRRYLREDYEKAKENVIAALTSTMGRDADICAACGSPRREHGPGGIRDPSRPDTLCGIFIPPDQP